ncbi:MAG: hypothetical protein U1E17_08575 [Geminicoccaceae bacterium]
MIAGKNERMAGAALGDARWLWRRLAGDRTLSEGERRIMADIEGRCRTCSAALACGAALAGTADSLSAPPVFCPGAKRFALLRLDGAARERTGSDQG